MSEKKKKALIYSIIATGVLLVAVIGATYAYFASLINNEANVNVNGSVDSATRLFRASSIGNILFENITVEDMSYDNNGLLQTQSAIIKVEYTSGSEALSTCTYDLVFNWDEGYEYTPSQHRGDALELSYQIIGTGKATSIEETQIKTGIVLNNEQITSKDEVKSVNEYTITMKFYNLTTVQNELGGKTYSGKWEINDVVCNVESTHEVLEDYTGYYADVDNNGTIDGIIFFDYTQGADTTVGDTFIEDYGNAKPTVVVEPITKGLKSYVLKTVEGHEKVVVPASKDGIDRFYVIELEDTKTVSGDAMPTWYYSAYETTISDYATVTSTAFGSGKTNTSTMKERWLSKRYGNQDIKDQWALDFRDTFILSKDEWLVLGSNLKKIATGGYSNMTFPSGASISFSNHYSSSSLENSNNAYSASFFYKNMSANYIDYGHYVRKALIF